MSRLKSPSSSMASVEIDMDGDSLGGTSAASELEQYLLEQKRSQNNNVMGYLSNMGATLGKYVPKRTGTGSIEDDIAVRFGNLFRSGSTTSNGDGSGVSSSTSSTSKSCCTLSRKERIIGFFVLLGMGLLFFTLSSFYIPVLIFAARKFSIFFTLGSVFTFASLSMLWGFTSFIKHLMTTERLPFTAMYFGSLFATLYFAIGLKSTVFTIIGIVLQIISLISFVVSYLPGGIAGMKYLTSFITSGEEHFDDMVSITLAEFRRAKS